MQGIMAGAGGRVVVKKRSIYSINATSRIPEDKGSTPKGFQASEFRFVLLIAVVLAVVTSSPYLLGHVTAPPGTQFTHVLINTYDQNNYLAYARQAASGQWLFHNPMTGEPHGDVFFNIEWLAVGKVSNLLGISLTGATHILRLLSIFVMCIAVYWLSAFCFHGVLMRRLTLVAVMTGGGFGWLSSLKVPLHQSYTADMWAGFFPFFCSMMVPHFLITQAFIILGICFVLSGEHSGRMRDFFLAGFCYLLAGSCRPYDMVYLLLGTSVYMAVMLVKDRQVDRLMCLRAIPVLMCIPLLLYYYWIFKVHPVFSSWSVPGDSPPSPLALSTSLGLAGLLLVPAAWRLRLQRADKPLILLASCLSVAVLLVYSNRIFHFSFQFASDIAVPLVMIVMMGFSDLLTGWHQNKKWGSLVIAVLLIVNGLTSFTLVTQTIIAVKRGYYFASVPLLSSIDWLHHNSSPREVVLANLDISNLLPQYSHVSVYCGYYNIDKFEDKFNAQYRFFTPGASDGFRREFVRENSIRFVLMTAAEAERIGSQMYMPSFRAVFRNEAATIYEVTDWVKHQ